MEHYFKGAIVLMGAESKGSFVCKSMEAKTFKRINYNKKDQDEIIDYLNKSIFEIIEEDRDAHFLWYSQIPDGIHKSIKDRSLYRNKRELTNLLSDKLKMRTILSSEMNVLSCFLRLTHECHYASLKEFFPDSKSFVLQNIHGTGGFSTYAIHSEKDNKILNNLNFECLASKYLDTAIPVNIHIIINENQIFILKPSIQIVQENNNTLFYIGADFASAQSFISENAYKKIINQSNIIGEKIQSLGYKGVAGIDFLVADDEVIFVEINPRFQASTIILNLCHIENKLPTVHELHIRSFINEIYNYNFNIPTNKSLFVPIFTGQKNVKKIEDIEKHCDLFLSHALAFIHHPRMFLFR